MVWCVTLRQGIETEVARDLHRTLKRLENVYRMLLETRGHLNAKLRLACCQILLFLDRGPSDQLPIGLPSGFAFINVHLFLAHHRQVNCVFFALRSPPPRQCMLNFSGFDTERLVQPSDEGLAPIHAVLKVHLQPRDFTDKLFRLANPLSVVQGL